MYLTKYKAKYALLKNRPYRIPRDQWTGLVSYWVSDKGKAKDGVEPTRAEVFILTHKKRKDGRPLDEESAKALDILQEKLSNGERSDEQPPSGVAWEGDVFSQVLGSE
ncbi:putative transposase, Ptta/En/Spm, plant [Sesbania bispinosa]|nr:putative transposase, Ptta/En/Spm, plant [Sesbania bispinosa]